MRGICKSLCVAFVSLLLPLQAFAGGKCYSPEEVQAEALLRLHSELMVVAVTCRQGGAGENLIDAYTVFTSEHIAPLHAAELTMSAYYKRTYGGDGVSRLDSLRTKLANEFGQQIANMTAPAFCAARRDMVLTLSRASMEKVVDESGKIGTKPYAPVCGEKIR